MVVRPPIGNLDLQDGEYWLLKKILYGLRRSPHHWNNMIKLIIINIGLNPSPHDPCLLYGVLINPSSPARTSYLQYQLHVGLYVKDLLFRVPIQNLATISHPSYKTVSTGSLRKIYMDYVDPPIIGTT